MAPVEADTGKQMASSKVQFSETVDEAPVIDALTIPSAVGDDADANDDANVEVAASSPTPRDILQSLASFEEEDDEDADERGPPAAPLVTTASSYLDIPFESEEMRQLLSYQSKEMPHWSSVEEMVYKQSELFPEWVMNDPNWASVKRANASTIVDILAVPESQVRWPFGPMRVVHIFCLATFFSTSCLIAWLPFSSRSLPLSSARWTSCTKWCRSS